MKKTIPLIASAFLFLFNVEATAAPEIFKLDPMHSYVLWHVSHFDFSNPSGKWFANGTLVLDKDDAQNDKVDITIKIDDLDTGIKELDDHLKGQLFFETKKYPTATFVSNKVDVIGEETAKVSGTLTLHGVSKQVVLNVKLNKMGISPVSNKMTTGFSGTAQIKRSDFGMTSFLPGVGDNVTLNFEVEAFKS